MLYLGAMLLTYFLNARVDEVVALHSLMGHRVLRLTHTNVEISRESDLNYSLDGVNAESKTLIRFKIRGIIVLG